MARIKYYDKTTQTWKYANTPFGGSPMEAIDEYVANANTFLTAGTIKTNTTTLNLPYSGSTQDQLGALLYLPEDDTNGTGMQIWVCVAENSSTHKNEIWRRVITNGKTQNPTYGTWERVTKPSGGWSDSDFTTAVQSVLDLAESALQPSALTAYRTSAAQDVIDGGKATKVTSATNGDLAALDSNGNLTDSGKKVSDFRLAADNLTYSDLSNSVQDSLDKADADNDRVNKMLEGSLAPKFSVNLTTSDKVEQALAWIIRTVAGTDSIANGPAQVVAVKGNNSTPVHVSAVASAGKTEATTATIAFTDPGTLTEDSYYLTYDGTNWKNGDSTVSLADFGITLTGTAYSGDSISIVKNESVYSASISQASRLTLAFSLTDFAYYAEVNSLSTGSYNIIYDGSAWKYNAETVTLADWGATLTGTTVLGDTIVITYSTAPSHGTISVTTPTSVVTTGFNSFNPADKLDGYTINASGDIVAQSGSYVGWSRCLTDTNGWVVGNRSGLTRVAYSGSIPTASTTGMTVLAKSNSLSNESTYGGQTYHNDAYEIANDGYIVFCGSTLDLVCCHPRWSGEYNWEEGGNQNYEAYEVSTVNLIGKTLTKNITRIAYTPQALKTLLEAHPTWIYGTDYSWDSSYIYHVSNPATETYSASSQLWSVGSTRDSIDGGNIEANDYGIEYVTGTVQAPVVSLIYSANLKDRLRHSVFYTEQILTEQEKAQARANIGAVSRKIKTTMDAIAEADTQYYLGSQATVSFALPGLAEAGQQISVVFYSGATATVLTVTGTTIGSIPTPSTNQRVELNFLYDGTNWAVLSNTMVVSV